MQQQHLCGSSWDLLSNIMAQPRYHHPRCDNTRVEQFRRYTDNEGTLIGVSCNQCLSEWTKDNFLPPDNQGLETIEVSGSTFYLIKKPLTESTSFSHLQDTRITDMDNLAEYLTPGDHVTYPWYLGFYHHAIVKDVEVNADGPDRVTLIHWQAGMVGGGILGVIEGSMVIEEAINDMRSQPTVIYRRDYDDGNCREDSRVLTLARANSWVGETGYHLFEKNCEHFAIFCKIGRHRSLQSESVANTVSALVRCFVGHQDERVTDLSSLNPGDHIVVYMTLIHPRCHMIVTHVDVTNTMIGVIRFTWQRGVVEERLDFPTKTVYKVVYETNSDPEEVLQRARNNEINARDYDIISYNCKHFAFWCKTGRIPPPEFIR